MKNPDVNVIQMRKLVKQRKDELLERLDCGPNSLLHEMVELWNAQGRRLITVYDTTELAEAAGISTKSVTRFRNQLAELGFLTAETQRGNGKNRYSFAPLWGMDCPFNADALRTDKGTIAEALGTDCGSIRDCESANTEANTLYTHARFTENREQRTENRLPQTPAVAAAPTADWQTTSTTPDPYEQTALDTAERHPHSALTVRWRNDPEFREFWAKYPNTPIRHYETAATAYGKVREAGVTHAEIMRGLTAWLSPEVMAEENQRSKWNAVSWLDNGGWKCAAVLRYWQQKEAKAMVTVPRYGFSNGKVYHS